MAKFKENSAKKRKKKNNNFLLLEPTVEEEQFAEMIKSNSSSNTEIKTGDSKVEKYSNFKRENQLKLSSSSSSKNVIPTTCNNEEQTGAFTNRCLYERYDVNAASGKKRSDRAQLASLLTFLFGLLMLLVGMPSLLAHTQQQSTQAAIFNLTSTTSVPKQLVKNLTIAFPFQVNNSSLTLQRANGSLSNEKEKVTIKVSLPATTVSVTTLPPMDTTTTLADDAGEEDVEDSGTGNNSSSGETQDTSNKLKILLTSTASEVADQFVGRLRSENSGNDNGEDSGEPIENEEINTSSSTSTKEEDNGKERRIDRRDNKHETSSSAKVVLPAEFDLFGSSNQSAKSSSEELKFAMDTYAKWRETGDEIFELFSRKILPVIVEHGYDVDAVTVTGLLQLFNGIRALKPWALKVLDASAKLTPGLLVGTQADFGDFDECLNVRVDDPSGLHSDIGSLEIDPSTGLPSSTVVGRYCLADVEFPKPPRVRLADRNEELQTDFAPIELRRPLLNFSQTENFKDSIFVETANFFHMLYVDPIRVGVCLTNKIEPESFAQVLNKLTKHLEVSINFHGRCVTKYDRPVWTRYQVVSAYVLIVACSLVALCTLMDLFHTKLNKLPLPVGLNKRKMELRNSLERYRPLFTSFSLIRNTKRLFKPQASKLIPERASNRSILASRQYSSNLKHCSTSVSGGVTYSQSSSSESSPSIERRSSAGSSALNLISDSSSLATNTTVAGNKSLQDCRLMAPVLPQCKNTTNNDENNLLCLHGIRVITMIWMIVNHTYLFGGFFVLWAHRRLIDIAEWPKSISFQLVLNGWLTVETYFFLSATIIVLNVMPLMKKRRFAYFSYILHRLVRLLPAYVGLVCLNFLWPLISSGPVWLVKGKSFIQTPCENYLWTNFLFINNWIWPEKQCMVHTWFLSADFQLYLLAPIIVYLLYKRPVFGHTLNIIVAILASLLSGFVIYANKLMPATLINKLEFDSIKQQLSYSYFATYQHMGPYCLGILIGYLLHKRPQVSLPRHITWLLWIFLPPLSFTTLLLTYLWNGAYDDPALINPSPLVSAFYVAIHRTIWTSLLAWIVFACATGRAKLMSSFLSHSIFIPISRLSFSIYLVHLPVIMFRALNLRHTIEWTDSNILWEACGNFIVSLIFGYFINIAFESPFINLERVIFNFGGGISTKGASSPQQNQSNASKSSLNNDTTDSSEDDNKSAKSLSSQSPASSSDREARKMSNLSVNTSSSNFQEGSPGGKKLTSWIQYESESGSLKRKSLKPKQNSSVEEIFGSQMEPLSLSGKTALVNVSGSLLEPSSLENTNSISQQMAPTIEANQSEPVRRYSSYELPNNMDVTCLTTPINDSLTSSSSFINDYHEQRARAIYLRQAQKFNYSRPTQYATLARSSRFDHQFNSGPAGRLDRLDYQHRLPQLFASNAKAKSQLGGDSISRLATPLEHEDTGNTSVRFMKHRAHLFQRRQGRYNTLTGAGAKEWRQQYSDVADNWHMLSSQVPEHLRRWDASEQDKAIGSNYLQPGTMIPRIDSSTLRRHNNKRAEPAGSIVEEPAFEDREDAVL